jgi:hypothetical protein
VPVLCGKNGGWMVNNDYTDKEDLAVDNTIKYNSHNNNGNDATENNANANNDSSYSKGAATKEKRKKGATKKKRKKAVTTNATKKGGTKTPQSTMIR